MAENRRPPETGGVQDPHGGPERRDVNARALIKFGVVFIIAGIVMHFVLVFVFNYFRAREAAEGPPPSQGIGRDARRLPPEPRLQPTPTEDLEQMRAAERKIVDGYAVLDPNGGVVRIPVSRAMDLYAQEEGAAGAPPPAQAPAPELQVSMPSESGLGPVMTQVGGPLSPNRVFPPDQELIIRGTGNLHDGRQAGGPPTPPERSLANPVEPAAPAGARMEHGQRPGSTQQPLGNTREAPPAGNVGLQEQGQSR